MSLLSTKVKKTQSITISGLVLTSMFTAVLCVLAQVSIPLVPIPLTLALFAIFLIGAVLPPRYAVMSVMSYILLGAFGLPVFAGMKGGVSSLTGMTGGFLMAYPLMAFITAMSCKLATVWSISRRKRLSELTETISYSSRKRKTTALTLGIRTLGMVVSLLLCYLLGSLWFSYSTGSTLYYTLTVCVFPFVLLDSIKIILALSVSQLLRTTVFRHFTEFNNLFE